MQPELIGAIAESLGALAVVISLFYVGKQVRENSKSMRGQTYQSLAAMASQIASNVVQDESYGELARKVVEGEPLTEGEYYRYQGQLLSIVRLVESAHYQYKLGLIDEQEFKGFAIIVTRQIGTVPGKRVWELVKRDKPGEFCDFVQSLSEDDI